MKLRQISVAVAMLAIIAMAGCSAAPLDVASITEIQRTALAAVPNITPVSTATAGNPIDIYESKRAAGVATPEFAGEQLLDVRTYTASPPYGMVELSGASCTLTSADFSAALQTPAKVRVPLYRQQSSSLAIVCDLAGYKKKKTTVAAVDVVREKRAASTATGGLVGMISVAAIDAFADDSKNDWEYPMAKVILVPDEVAAH